MGHITPSARTASTLEERAYTGGWVGERDNDSKARDEGFEEWYLRL
jgi:hypothetical protein